MSKNLLIVESPTKAGTIEKYLGPDFKVLATYGHLKDLPKSTLGVDPKNNFKPQYIIPTKARKNLNLIVKEAKQAKTVFLATDPDREGEAIAWHVAESIDAKDVKRVLFYEITKEGVTEAVNSPTKLNEDLYNAQQARRILDRLVGYSLSPLLWKKVRRGLSAGRVQSVTVKIIVDREREIQNFKPEEYWDLAVDLSKEKDLYRAKIIKYEDKELKVLNAEEAKKIEKDLENENFQVSDIVKREIKKRPTPPFITSTLQQEAAKKYGFSSKRTMMIAQQLYEGLRLGEREEIGLITYMRTDSLNLSEKFKSEARSYIVKEFGQKYLIDHDRVFKKSKLSQEAHEAIRPTSISLSPDSIKQYLANDQSKIYSLIYNRALASLMSDAVFAHTRVDITGGKYLARTTGQKILFEGFMKLYQETIESEEEIEAEQNLEKLVLNDQLKLEKILADQKFTQPPARLSEASLIKILEENGIGRPSTYAPIISTIQIRNYVRLENKRFVPEEIGFVVTDLLEKNFPFVVNVSFTAGLENQLDEIATGERKWQEVLKEFWFPFEKELESKTEKIERVKMPVRETDEICDLCGHKMVIKVGRYGEFLACSNFPTCKNTKPILKKIGMSCPECKSGEVIEKRTKKGRVFWGCSRFPKCKYATWNNPKKTVEENKK